MSAIVREWRHRMRRYITNHSVVEGMLDALAAADDAIAELHADAPRSHELRAASSYEFSGNSVQVVLEAIAAFLDEHPDSTVLGMNYWPNPDGEREHFIWLTIETPHWSEDS